MITDKAFSIAGPRLWNEPPVSLRKAANIHTLMFELVYIDIIFSLPVYEAC